MEPAPPWPPRLPLAAYGSHVYVDSDGTPVYFPYSTLGRGYCVTDVTFKHSAVRRLLLIECVAIVTAVVVWISPLVQGHGPGHISAIVTMLLGWGACELFVLRRVRQVLPLSPMRLTLETIYMQQADKPRMARDKVMDELFAVLLAGGLLLAEMLRRGARGARSAALLLGYTVCVLMRTLYIARIRRSMAQHGAAQAPLPFSPRWLIAAYLLVLASSVIIAVV